MTWDAYHHRGDVLRSVVDAADRRRDGVLPRDLPGVTQTFPDDLALIAALQLKWHTRLNGEIERSLMEQPMDLETAVLTAWRRTASELAGVRQILDDAIAEPATPEIGEAMTRSHRKDWVLLAAMAGRASAADAGALRVGRRIEERARAAYDPTVATRHDEPAGVRGQERRASLIGRLRAHLAA